MKENYVVTYTVAGGHLCQYAVVLAESRKEVDRLLIQHLGNSAYKVLSVEPVGHPIYLHA